MPSSSTSTRGKKDRSVTGSRTTRTTVSNGGSEEDHPDLLELEERLNHDVDDEFFQDPRKFHTLHRVIDVLGMQLDSGDRYMEDTAVRERDLASNPAYQNLKRQQQIVEEAIEHLALIHCADLNGSVVQVGRVARQFHDAVTQVRHLRKQVKEIQETLGSNNANATAVAAQSAMSLRELWLKKLEAEAVLSLLDKLDRIRAAPRQFDLLVDQHRIGAAVITIASALDTMFSSDVSQVQALHKIMEQLMMRKQKAEEIVWDLLMDIVFLRNGNRLDDHPLLVNPFLTSTVRFALEQDLQVDQQIIVVEEAAEDWQQDDDVCQDSMLIPLTVMDAEFDLESEERRHLEELKDQQDESKEEKDAKPRYADHVLALRTLVECLIRLRRVDDVERIIVENVSREVEALVQREQARTFLRVENIAARSRYAMLQKSDLRDFRRHLESVVSAFGNVQLRLVHLAQIVRHRLVSAK